jgi:hypothetical protein
MPLLMRIRHFSDLLAENREFMYHYRQLTPTRNGSHLDTLRYYRAHRNHTWKLFGLIDTGIRDYGMKPHRYPLSAIRLYACLFRIWRLRRRQDRERRAHGYRNNLQHRKTGR